MRVPLDFIPYGRQDISEADIKLVDEVLSSDFLTGGPYVKNFESSLAEKVKSDFAVTCSSGTAALHLALMSIGCQKGDAVFVPSLSFAATANAVLYCGAMPIFVDIDKQSKTISPKSLLAAIELSESKNLNPKAIIPVHYAGQPADMASIKELATIHNMTVVEDACHALGASYNQLPIGSCSHSSMACFSFHPVKHIATGEGGAITTNDPLLAQKLSDLRSHGIVKEPERLLSDELSKSDNLFNPWYQEMQFLGFNYRMPDINAALGYSQLERLNENLIKRQSIADFYRNNLKDLAWLHLPKLSHSTTCHGYHLFAIDIDFQKLGQSRAEVMNRLRDKNIGTQVHYLPIHLHRYYQDHKDLWNKVELSHSVNHYASTLSIPIYSSLEQVQAEYIVDNLHQLGRLC